MIIEKIPQRYVLCVLLWVWGKDRHIDLHEHIWRLLCFTEPGKTQVSLATLFRYSHLSTLRTSDGRFDVAKCSTADPVIPPERQHHQSVHLRAGHTRRNVRAAAVLLASRNRDSRPGPPSASTGPTGDHDVIPAAGDSARPGDGVEGEACDGNARGGSAAVEISAIVVLLDQDTVPGVGSDVSNKATLSLFSSKLRGKLTLRYLRV